MRTTLLLLSFSLIGCEFVELHPCAKADCGLFPEAGVSDADLDDAGRPGDASVDGGLETSGRIYVLSRASAQPLPGVPLIIGDSMVRTDPMGRAEVTLSPGPFEVAVNLPGALPHRLYGEAKGGQFDQVFYIWPTALLNDFLSAQQSFLDMQKNVLIAALIDGQGKPAVGAKATQSQMSDAPISIAGQTASPSDSLRVNDDGWLMFGNSLAGETILSATGPNGMPCTRFPGRTPGEAIDLRPGEVATVIFICE